VGNIPSFVDKLSVTRVIDNDDFIYRAICFKSRALWNAAKFSKSLPTLAIACEFWLANLESRYFNMVYIQMLIIRKRCNN
jgi:hypothetical protein